MSLEDAFAAMSPSGTQGGKNLGAQVPKNSGAQVPEPPGAEKPKRSGAQELRRPGTQAPNRLGPQEPLNLGAQVPRRSGTQALVKSTDADWEPKKFFVHKATFRAAVRKWEDLHDGQLDVSDLIQHLLLGYSEAQ